MTNYNGSVVLPDDTPMTYQQLIHAAIAARTYSAVGATNTKLRAAETSRFTAAPVAEIVNRPQGDIYCIDGYKGLRNGAVIPGVWVEADFTAEPGGGELLMATQTKELGSGYHCNAVDIGTRILYQKSGVSVVCYLDVTIR